MLQPLSCRLIRTSAVCHKVVAGRVRVSKGEKPVTYEAANPPHHIGLRKSWNSKNTCKPYAAWAFRNYISKKVVDYSGTSL